MDITDPKRVESERRIRNDQTERILDTCPVTILVLDADRTITFGNERAKEVMGADEIA
ncbi:MAG: hypothetical protein IH933_02310, partial [Euryarchaeota archaeon]|nr:hypothetical protein [Euryarchaeota archaeon]